MEQYEIPKLAEIIHSFPHLDFTFAKVDPPIFRPIEQTYRESLLLWAALPVLWMLLLLLLQLLYFCYRCCRHDDSDVINVGSTSRCLDWALSMLALLCCGAVIVGFFGNSDVTRGADRFLSAKHNFHDSVNRTIYQIDYMEHTVISNVNKVMEELKNKRDLHRLDETARTELQAHLDRVSQATSELSSSLHKLRYNATRQQFSSVDDYLIHYSFYRWLSVIILLGLLILLLLLLLIAIGRSSKPTLLVFCASGILSLVVCWLCVGFHISLSIAVSDFCMDPHPTFERPTAHSDELDRYYIYCEEAMKNPFTHALQSMSDNARLIKSSHASSVAIIARYSRPGSGGSSRITPQPFDHDLFDPIIRVSAFLECTNHNKNYADAVTGVCCTGLTGLTILTFSTAIAGLLFPILVILASAAWRYLGQRKIKTYCASSASYEERGVFLPRPESSSPNYPRYSREAGGAPGGGGREQLSLSHRPPTAPEDIRMAPPGYNTSLYYRQAGGSSLRGGAYDASL